MGHSLGIRIFPSSQAVVVGSQNSPPHPAPQPEGWVSSPEFPTYFHNDKRKADSWPHHWSTKSRERSLWSCLLNKFPRWMLWPRKRGTRCSPCVVGGRWWGCLSRSGEHVSAPFCMADWISLRKPIRLDAPVLFDGTNKVFRNPYLCMDKTQPQGSK